MLKNILSLIIAVSVLSCNNHNDERPATAIETGRTFIRSSLNGDFETAEKLLLKDTQNVQLFESYKTTYDRLAEEKKNNYKKSEYNINKYEDINDSTTIINYSNTYLQRPMEIKVVRKNSQWSVDFKYTISGNLPID